MEKYFTIRNGRANLASTKNFSTLHIGCITPYLGTKDNVPRGYLLADGASYKTTDYPELFDIIGYTYGGSDDTFNVPNLCDGRFLEGSDTSGEYVEAGLPNITGTFGLVRDDYGATSGAFSVSRTDVGIGGSGGTTGNVNFDASKSNAIYGASDTVQPKSLRVLYIIKAFHTNEGVDSKNEVSDPIIEYVEGEIAEVDNKIDALISDTSSTTSTYSSAKIDTELAKKPTKYSKTYAGTHSRYIKIGSIPVSSGVVSKATILMSLFSSSDQIEAYPVGFLTINMSSGSNNNRFNINGTTTIPLNNSTNLTTPRIVVEKTSTYYNLYVDCKYNYMWIDYMLLQTDTHYVNGNFEELDALEGTEYWSSVTSDDIKYVGEMSKVTTRSLTLQSGYSGYITEVYDPTTKVVVYNINVSGTFKGLLNSIADGFRVPKGSTSSSDVMHQAIGMYGSSSAMTGDAQFTRLLVRNYGNPHLEVDVNAENTVISGTITYVTA